MPTESTNILPESTGLDLGSTSQRWDIVARDADFSGTVTLTGNVTTTGDITADQFVSTVATGSAPLTVSSTTKVSNLNVDLLDGADWAAPAALGSTTPAAVSATTISGSTATLTGDVEFSTGAGHNIEFSSSSASQRNLAITGCESTSTTGGDVTITAGLASGSGQTGGHAKLIGGAGTTTGLGGNVTIQAGAAGTSGSTGGAVAIVGGSGGTTSGTGGDAQLAGGTAQGGNGDGGNVIISPGLPNGTGNYGNVVVDKATSAYANIGGLSNSNTTAVTVNTDTTSDQSLMSYTVPAKMMNRAGRLMRVRGYGVYTTQAGQTPTVTIKVKLGAVTVASWVSAATTASQTNKPFNFDCDIVCASTGATGTVEAHGKTVIQIGSGTNGADSAVHSDTNTAASSAIDLTASNSLQITATFSTSTSPANAATQRLMTVEVY